MPTAMSRTPITHTFADDGRIPNNPTLPLVLYRGGIDLTGSPDPEALIEKTFTVNGRRGLWRAAAPRCASAATMARRST